MHQRTLRTVLVMAAVAVALLAPKFAALAAACSEVQGLSSWRVATKAEWRRGVLDEVTGEWTVHVGLPGEARTRVIIRGNVGQGPASRKIYDDLRFGGEGANVLPRPAKVDEVSALTPALQAAQDCLTQSVQNCCGGDGTVICAAWCGAFVDVSCTGPDGTPNDQGIGNCVVDCYSIGCEWEHCGWLGLWCDCPDLAAL